MGEAVDVQLAEMLARSASRSKQTANDKISMCLLRFKNMHTELYKQDEVQAQRSRRSVPGRHWKKYNHRWATEKINIMAEEKKTREETTVKAFQQRSQRTQTSDEVFRIAKKKVKEYILKMKPHKPLGSEQWVAVEYALMQARDNKQCLMLVHGKWGTGKTRTINAIRYGIKCMGIACLCTRGPDILVGVGLSVAQRF